MHRSLEGKGTLGNQEGRVFEEQRRALEEWRTPCRANSRVKTSGVLLLLFALQKFCKCSFVFALCSASTLQVYVIIAEWF